MEVSEEENLRGRLEIGMKEKDNHVAVLKQNAEDWKQFKEYIGRTEVYD
jgi:hypothetical protein